MLVAWRLCQALGSEAHGAKSTLFVGSGPEPPRTLQMRPLRQLALTVARALAGARLDVGGKHGLEG